MHKNNANLFSPIVLIIYIQNIAKRIPSLVITSFSFTNLTLKLPVRRGRLNGH